MLTCKLEHYNPSQGSHAHLVAVYYHGDWCFHQIQEVNLTSVLPRNMTSQLSHPGFRNPILRKNRSVTSKVHKAQQVRCYLEHESEKGRAMIRTHDLSSKLHICGGTRLDAKIVPTNYVWNPDDTVNLHILGPLWQAVGHPFSLLLSQPNSAIKEATLYCPGRWPTVYRKASGRHWPFLQGHPGLEMTFKPIFIAFSGYITAPIIFSMNISLFKLTTIAIQKCTF